jgi:hypothetical protein
MVSGKGEYTLSYWMILSWYKYFPAVAVYALKYFVLSPSDEQLVSERSSQQLTTVSTVGAHCNLVGSATDGIQPHPIGSWKDMKRMAELCKTRTGNENHEIIQTCIRLINTQLKEDMIVDVSDSEAKISLCAKWVPREGSRYSWFFKALAEDFYNISMVSVPIFCILSTMISTSWSDSVS